MKTALITGISGQDGSYLAELLLEKNYKVHGLVRRSSSIHTNRIDHLLHPDEKIILHYGDLTSDVTLLLDRIEPDEIYNLAAQSHVRVSFDVPVYTLDTNAIGPMRLLEAIRIVNPNIKYYQASSSEMYGMSPPPQDEDTPFRPCSPYGIAKLAAYWTTRLYRDAYGLFASNGILFNHESERRGETFVTKKIVRAAVRIKLGKQRYLRLGNLDAKRDWGHSKDYVRAINLILQHTDPDDFVVATSEQYSVKEFLEKVFISLGLPWEDYVVFSDKYKRPKEVPSLLGDASKIKQVLGWEPQIKLDKLIAEMIKSAMVEETNERNYQQNRQ